MKASPDRSFAPRLSEAKRLLPLISHHLEVASSNHPHCAALDLWPIVEEGLFGYELIPDRETRAYLIIGRNARDQPCLRTTSYGADYPDALRLAAAGGLLVSPGERDRRFSVQRRDEVFSEWLTAANAACAQLRSLFPNIAGTTAPLAPRAHHFLEDALRVAHSHLARWDPLIDFFGLPLEAHVGFPLLGANGKQGELTLQDGGIWKLRWKAVDEVVAETWPTSMNASAMEKAMNGDDLFFGDARMHQLDRRMHQRRAMDRGKRALSWVGKERRSVLVRRQEDRHGL